MSCTGPKLRSFAESAGKGTVGCLLSLILLVVGVFAGVRTIPLYYSAVNFETDLKSEVSRAGARFYDDETMIKDILDLAKKDEVSVKQDDIKLQRMVGQIFVTVDWTVPVDFIVFEYTFLFNAQASSYIGKL